MLNNTSSIYNIIWTTWFQWNWLTSCGVFSSVSFIYFSLLHNSQALHLQCLAKNKALYNRILSEVLQQLSSSVCSRYTPGIWFFVTVVKWFETELFFLLAQSSWIAHLEKLGCEFNQPLWVSVGYLSHVLLCGQDQLMINHPVKI